MKNPCAFALVAIMASACGWAFGQTGWIGRTAPASEASDPVKAVATGPQGSGGTAPEAMSNEQLLNAVRAYRAQKREANDKERECLNVLRTRADALRGQLETLDAVIAEMSPDGAPSNTVLRQFECGARP